MNSRTCSLAFLALIASTSVFPLQSQSDSRKVEVDFSRVIGNIRPLHDVHSGPLTERGSIDLSPYYSELGVRFVRLHDVPWTFGGGVDVNYVFPHFEENAELPKNYEFVETDRYIQSIKALGAKMIYRVGYSAEIKNQPKLHRVPPKDFEKWARIGVNIVRHYNDGWANGFHHEIGYWEIWNEPDIPNFWSGTPEEYYRLYQIAAKAIKNHDPKLKVGGPALAANMNFLEGFLNYCRTRNVPLDFVSWHIYSRDPYSVYLKSVKVRELLNKYGYSNVESILDEWNYFPGDWDRLEKDSLYEKQIFEEIQGAAGAAYDASVLIYLQDSTVDIANFYTGTTLWWGLFDQHGVPLKPYYTFKAFKLLLDTPDRVLNAGSDMKGFAVLAGLSQDKSTANILISNFAGAYERYNLELKNIPWAGQVNYELFRIDSDRDFQLVKSGVLSAPNYELREEARVPSVTLIKLRQAQRQ